MSAYAHEVGRRAWQALPRMRSRLETARPATLLVPAIVVQWLLILALAVTVQHNGWVFYQGGDQLWYWGSAFLLAHGTIPYALVGLGWPAALAPLTAIVGPNLVTAFPLIALFDVLVLYPVFVLCVYGIAQRIGGRLFAYWAVFVLITVPFIGIKYTDAGYHQKYTELLLPQAFGLTAMADFPSLVAVVVSAYFCMRVLERPDALDAVAAGLAAGAAISIKPGSAPYLLGPLLAFAWRRWAPAFPLFILGIAPPVVALALWKYRGYGYLPVFHAQGAVRLASGQVVGSPLSGLHRYIHLDWTQLNDNLLGIKEHFWSRRVIEWLVIAGLIGLLRRSIAAGLLVGGWFAGFVLVKGTYLGAGITDGSLFRVMMPSFPAFVLLLASLPLLLPGVSRRLGAPRPAFAEPSQRTKAVLVGAAAVVFGLYPLALVAAASPLRGPSPQAYEVDQLLNPVDGGLRLTASAHAQTVRLSWRAASQFGGNVIYQVMRTNAPAGGTACTTIPNSVDRCTFSATTLGYTRSPHWTDTAQKGRWTYRVGVVANWEDDQHFGDVYFIGPPAVVRVG